jgi:ribosomal protein L14E/L6E/L27E
MNEIMPKDVVLSVSGRDKGRIFAVIDVDEKYVYICDGKERPLSRPKRKNRRHVSPTRHCVESEAFRGNKALKKALSQISINLEERSSGTDS